MNALELLDRPIAYHRVFVTLTGSVKAAVLLSQAVYWQKRAKQADGWWYKTAEEWTEETGLSKHEQDTARRDCEKYLKTDLRSVPATLFWHVDEEALSQALFSLNGESSLAKSAKQDLPKQENINRNTENTTENILDSEDLKQVNKKVDAIIGMSNGDGWQGRELIRADLLPLADWYNKATNQVMTKRAQKSWWKALGEWKEEGLQPEHLQIAFDNQSKWRMVSDPNMLTKDAVAIKAAGVTKLDVPKVEMTRLL